VEGQRVGVETWMAAGQGLELAAQFWPVHAASLSSATRPRMPGVNYVGGSRQLRWRVGAPNPLPWQGVGPRWVWGQLAGY
jgi:hypothetical protein